MTGAVTGRTVVDADFAGRRRRFQLRLGEIGELERLAGAGIGAILMRIASHQFSVRDVWETIRLGLEGGGTPAIEASALVLRYRDAPLMDFLPLAGSIVAAAVNGAPTDTAAGKPAAEGSAPTPPATSPPLRGESRRQTEAILARIEAQGRDFANAQAEALRKGQFSLSNTFKTLVTAGGFLLAIVGAGATALKAPIEADIARDRADIQELKRTTMGREELLIRLRMLEIARGDSRATGRLLGE